MSGGHFDYKQYLLEDIADSLDRLIATNDPNDDGEYHHEFSKDILVKFEMTATQLRKTADMVQQIDWLVCGDSSEESFRKTWEENINK